MPSSLEWRLYYEQNAFSLLDIPWQVGADLTRDEMAAIAQSLKEFQAGESSEGKHLLGYAKEYATSTGDQEYVAAIRLFIAEEQRHARDLGRFLTLNAIPLVHTTFADRVFRRLRNLIGGLEVSIGVLITAEIIAKVYYAVVRDATQSRVLRRLCEQILRDELRHVQFQAEQLGKLRADRSWVGMAAAMTLQRCLYLGTVLVVWLIHRRAIRRGGFTCFGWWKSCWAEFGDAFAPPSPNQARCSRPRYGAATSVPKQAAIPPHYPAADRRRWTQTDRRAIQRDSRHQALCNRSPHRPPRFSNRQSPIVDRQS